MMTVVAPKDNPVRAAFEEAISEFNEKMAAEKLLTDPKLSESEKREFLVTEVMKELTLRTLEDTDEILFYENGIYKPRAEPKIRAELQRIGGSEITNARRNEVLASIRALTYSDRKQFDQGSILNLRNGLLDLSTWEFKEHSPDCLSMRQLPVKYDPKATCREVIEFLYDVIADPTDVPLILEYLAYCLMDDKDLQKEVMLVGPPDCGKSKMLDVMTAFLGSENVSNVTMQQLSTNRFALAQLFGKLSNIYADISHARLEDIERFKAIATADEVEAEKKGMQLFKFRPRAKLIYSANMPPRPPITVDDSFYRRWWLIQCALREKHYFSKTPVVKDPKVTHRLVLDDQLSGLLNIVLISMRRLLKKQKFCKETSTDATRDVYDRLSNPVQMWIESRCEEDEESYIEIGAAYKNYIEFCQVRKIGATTKEWVGKELGRLGYISDQKRIDGKQKRVWQGLKLKESVTRNTPFPSFIQENTSSIEKGKDALHVTNSEQSQPANTEAPSS